ncbi:MAG: hypothetical protein AB8C13_05500 [Phycisphaerales bacterium]
MNSSQHAEFWDMYEAKARPAIERACRSASRTLTDSTMDIDDMIAWVDTKVWGMLEKNGYPTFHDHPTPEQAINRIITHAPTLARWSYLALCRKHFKRLQHTSEYISGMSKSQRLAATSAVDSKIDGRSDLDSAIDTLREKLSPNEKQRLAASWMEKSDRHRIAMVLGADRREDDRMIIKTSGSAMSENTVQQMRSRARKRAQEILNQASKLPLLMIASLLILTVSMTSTPASAGEQTGGRKGMSASAVLLEAHAHNALTRETVIPGEQTGGRGPKNG